MRVFVCCPFIGAMTAFESSEPVHAPGLGTLAKVGGPFPSRSSYPWTTCCDGSGSHATPTSPRDPCYRDMRFLGCQGHGMGIYILLHLWFTTFATFILGRNVASFSSSAASSSDDGYSKPRRTLFKTKPRVKCYLCSWWGPIALLTCYLY